MKVNVDIPHKAIEEETKKKIKDLERKLKNAERRAERYKDKVRSLETFLQKANIITNLAHEIGMAAGMREEDYDRNWRANDDNWRYL